MKKVGFNDNWRLFEHGTTAAIPVTLPHDAMLHGQRDRQSPSGSAQGYFRGGAYSYEKTFDAPREWLTRHVEFQFEGVYKNARVYLNGTLIGGAAYGYIPFFAAADDALREGSNLLRVECENLHQPDSRWYTGAGIYRPVWLWTGEKIHIKPEGIRVSTLSVHPARIRVEVDHTGGADCETLCEILDGDRTAAVCSGGEAELPDAVLWSEETPRLYRCRVTLKQDGRVCDTAEVRFGVRKLEWDAGGLFLNGESILLRGGCLHHDSGILGAATYDESEYRRVKRLKEAGYNAIRSAHNPASRALLDACDELGVFVMDESWDMWYKHKSRYDYASYFMANYRSDLAAMVSRDFNHPSVIFYSIGNEVSEPATPKGVALAREMVQYLHELDGSRAVTGGFNLMILTKAAKGKAMYDEDEGGLNDDSSKKLNGMNSTVFNMVTSVVGTGMNKAANSDKADKMISPLMAGLDICGYNYASGRYPLEGRKHPERLIFGSETFPQDIGKNWEMVQKYHYLVGDFMWTAWDYLGEAGIGAWAYTPDGRSFNKPYPWLLADVGAFDILGDPTGEAFWAQAVWGKLPAPAIAVRPVNHDRKPAKGVWRGTNAIPCWSWRGCEGKPAVVEVYFDCAWAELLLNGKRIGLSRAKHCRCVFKTRYRPGKLEAVAYAADGRELGRSALETAACTAIHVQPEKQTASPGEVLYVPVMIGDGRNAEGNADTLLQIAVSGGEQLAFGSADPRTEERFDTGRYTSYYGRALAVVRAGKRGAITVEVSGKHGTGKAVIPVVTE